MNTLVDDLRKQARSDDEASLATTSLLFEAAEVIEKLTKDRDHWKAGYRDMKETALAAIASMKEASAELCKTAPVD